MIEVEEPSACLISCFTTILSLRYYLVNFAKTKACLDWLTDRPGSSRASGEPHKLQQAISLRLNRRYGARNTHAVGVDEDRSQTTHPAIPLLRDFSSRSHTPSSFLASLTRIPSAVFRLLDNIGPYCPRQVLAPRETHVSLLSVSGTILETSMTFIMDPHTSWESFAISSSPMPWLLWQV